MLRRVTRLRVVACSELAAVISSAPAGWDGVDDTNFLQEVLRPSRYVGSLGDVLKRIPPTVGVVKIENVLTYRCGVSACSLAIRVRHVGVLFVSIFCTSLLIRSAGLIVVVFCSESTRITTPSLCILFRVLVSRCL